MALKNTTQHSQVYRWMLNSYTAHWKPKHDDKDPCPLNSDADPDHLLAIFMYEVTGALAIREKDVDSNNCSCCNDICQYHEHESKEEWEASTSTRSVWFQLLTNECLACGQLDDTKMPALLKNPENLKSRSKGANK